MANEDNIPVVAIDGPAGAGKGAIGQRLAITLGWWFLDSGALYRSAAYLVQTMGISVPDPKLTELLSSLQFESVPTGDGGEATIILNGEDVSSKIRNSEVGNAASVLAADPTVRSCLLEIQRAFCRTPGLVADGRDMGTVVFPDARLKIYLTADLEIRAKRKYLQLKTTENYVKFVEFYGKMAERDERDSSRSDAPLSVADDAFVLDTSNLSLDEVETIIVDKITTRI